MWLPHASEVTSKGIDKSDQLLPTPKPNKYELHVTVLVVKYGISNTIVLEIP